MTPNLHKLIEEKMAVLRGIYAAGMSAVALNALLYEFEDFAEDIALKAQEELREEIRKEIQARKLTCHEGNHQRGCLSCVDASKVNNYIDFLLFAPSLSPQPAEKCDHTCSSNCRRVGCNCDCGEYHKPVDNQDTTN